MMFKPCLTFALGLTLLGSSAAVAADEPRAAATAILQAYIAAWDHADAHALGAQFAADGDFISPTGDYARGPAAVEAFYRSAFSRGYAGSRGGFTLKSVRTLTKDVVAVDGLWSIDGAQVEGHAMAPERGIATAVIVRKDDVWRVALLREQSSAKALDIPTGPETGRLERAPARGIAGRASCNLTLITLPWSGTIPDNDPGITFPQSLPKG